MYQTAKQLKRRTFQPSHLARFAASQQNCGHDENIELARHPRAFEPGCSEVLADLFDFDGAGPPGHSVTVGR